jgi:hypothetical protein
MSCSSCNNNIPQANITLNQTCSINVDSAWITNTDLVKYTGDNLSCIGVFTNDTLTTALQDINTSICPENIATVLLDTIESNPQYVATFANFVNQTIIDCTTTTTTSTSTSTSTTSSTSTTTTTTTNSCHTTSTTTTSILTPICLSYSAIDCPTSCLAQCTVYYVTNACAVNLTPGCQIYINQNLTPAPAGFYSYNGDCFIVSTQGTILTQAACTGTTSTTSTTTTIITPFALCYSPLSTGSCADACVNCFTTTTTSTTAPPVGSIVFENICGPFPVSNYQTVTVEDCCNSISTAS